MFQFMNGKINITVSTVQKSNCERVLGKGLSDVLFFGFICLGCVPGTIFVEGSCLPCPIAYYQPQYNQTSCIICPYEKDN